MLFLTRNIETHLEQIHLLSVNQRQKRIKWLNNALAPHFHPASGLMVFGYQLAHLLWKVGPCILQLMVFLPCTQGLHGAQQLLPPPATPPWFPTRALLAQHSRLDGLQGHRPLGFCYMGKTCQRLSSNWVFPSILHRIVKLCKLGWLQSLNFPLWQANPLITQCFEFLRGLFKASSYFFFAFVFNDLVKNNKWQKLPYYIGIRLVSSKPLPLSCIFQVLTAW